MISIFLLLIVICAALCRQTIEQYTNAVQAKALQKIITEQENRIQVLELQIETDKERFL